MLIPISFFYSPTSESKFFKWFGYSLKKGAMILFYASVLFLWGTYTFDIIDNAESNKNAFGVVEWFIQEDGNEKILLSDLKKIEYWFS